MDCMLYLVMACGPFCWEKTVVSINLFVFSLVYLLPRSYEKSVIY